MTRLAVVLALAVGQTGSEVPEWRVELRSSGGITGRGAGSISVQADGTVALTRAAAVRRPDQSGEPTCTVRLPDKVKPVADALHGLQPDTWRERYTPGGNPGGCCDQFQWDLEVTRAGGGSSPGQLRTSWVGEPAPDLPPDLSRLRSAVLDVWNAAKPSCETVQ
jgi:hypothetical protein